MGNMYPTPLRMEKVQRKGKISAICTAQHTQGAHQQTINQYLIVAEQSQTLRQRRQNQARHWGTLSIRVKVRTTRPPWYPLIASARESIASMSRWLVGSSSSSCALANQRSSRKRQCTRCWSVTQHAVVKD